MDFTHIKTTKNPDHKQKPLAQSQDFLRKESFATETEATSEELPSNTLTGISTLSGNTQGGTFAQRARAAELQAARARTDLKSKDPQALPSSPPRRLLTLDMPRKQKWAPLDLVALGVDLSPTPGLTSNNDNLGDSSDNGDLLVADQEINEHEATDENARSSMISNAGQRTDHFSSRLYGSRPTTTLQSQDLAEYPIELGARIENRAGPSLQGPLRGESPQNRELSWILNQQFRNLSGRQLFANNEQDTEGQNQNPLLPRAVSDSQQAVNTQPAKQSHFEEDVIQSLVKGDGATHHLHPSGSNLYHEAEHALPASNLAMNGSSRSIHAKSYTAVRGTPAAINDNMRLTPMNPAANPFFSNQIEGRGSRRPSIQEREFLVRHLNSFVDENAGHRTQQSRRVVTAPSHLPSNKVIDVRQLVHKSNPAFQSRQISGTISQNDPFEEHTRLHSKRTGVWAPDKYFRVNNPSTQEPGNVPETNSAERRAALEKEVAEWWVSDNRVPVREKTRVQEAILMERQAMKDYGKIFNLDDYEDYDQVVKTMAEEAAAPYTNEDMVNELLIPVIATLASYKSDRQDAKVFSKPPSWAIDHTPGANSSFFSQQWGTPPQRVGRDPRYRALQHDGRSSVFEDPTGRNPREEFSHGRGRWGFQNDKFQPR